MPLSQKGKTILKAMENSYGKARAQQVFYASENRGTIRGVHQGRPRKSLLSK